MNEAERERVLLAEAVANLLSDAKYYRRTVTVDGSVQRAILYEAAAKNIQVGIRNLQQLQQLRRDNPVVAAVLDAGGTATDCVVELVKLQANLLKDLMTCMSIAPFKMRLPDGTVKIWRCPEHLVPERWHEADPRKNTGGTPMLP